MNAGALGQLACQAPQALDRFGVAIEALERLRESLCRVEVVPVEAQRSFETTQRGVEALLRQQEPTQVVEWLRIARRLPDRLLEETNRLLVATQLADDDSEQVQRLRVAGLKRNRGAQLGLGLLRARLVVERLAEVAVGLRVGRVQL